MSWFKRYKFYEEVKCLACDGTGKRPPFQLNFTKISNLSEEQFDILNKQNQGICTCCNGKGTQTVLEREE